MVVVMPRFSKGRNSEQGIIRAAVLKLIRTISKYVANRIDAPGGVMDKQNPNEATPNETVPGPQPASGDGAFGGGRQGQSQTNPDKIQAIQLEYFPVLQQIANIGAPVREFVMEHPSHVRMPKAPQNCANTGTIKMG